MRLGWLSTSIRARTGYGKMTREVTTRLVRAGHNVTVIGEEDVHVWGSDLDYRAPDGTVVPTLPISSAGNTDELVGQYCRKFGIDLIIAHWDAWVLPKMLQGAGRPFALYAPIDAPLTPKWLGYLQGARKVIAFSKFAQTELEKHFPPSQVDYVPHGVDCSVFRPRIEDKEEIREVFPVVPNIQVPPGAFLMATIQANSGPRKQLPQLLKTFRRFSYRHPDAFLYLHTNMAAESPQGYQLLMLCKQLHLQDRVVFPISSPVISAATDEELNEVYNAADVYVTSSLGEGFGIPLLEAQASGTPVIAPAHSSHSELIRGHGYLSDCVSPDVYTDFPLYVPTLQEFPVPDQRSLLEKMELAYADWKTGKIQELGKASRRFAEGYDWPRVMAGWERALRDLTEEQRLFADVREQLRMANQSVPGNG